MRGPGMSPEVFPRRPVWLQRAGRMAWIQSGFGGSGLLSNGRTASNLWHLYHYFRYPHQHLTQKCAQLSQLQQDSGGMDSCRVRTGVGAWRVRRLFAGRRRMRFDRFAIEPKRFRLLWAAALALPAAGLAAPVAALPEFAQTETIDAPPGVTLTVRLDDLFDNAGTNPVFIGVGYPVDEYLDTSRTALEGDTRESFTVTVKTASELSALPSPPPSPFTFTAHVGMRNDEGQDASGTVTFRTIYTRTPTRPRLRGRRRGRSSRRRRQLTPLPARRSPFTSMTCSTTRGRTRDSRVCSSTRYFSPGLPVSAISLRLTASR